MKTFKKYIAAVAISCFTFIVSMLLFGVNASAYIDPSVTTYVIQAAAGVIIAAGTAIGIYWRKAKKGVQDKLGLEETKEQESDDIIIKDDTEKIIP